MAEPRQKPVQRARAGSAPAPSKSAWVFACVCAWASFSQACVVPASGGASSTANRRGLFGLSDASSPRPKAADDFDSDPVFAPLPSASSRMGGLSGRPGRTPSSPTGTNGNPDSSFRSFAGAGALAFNDADMGGRGGAGRTRSPLARGAELVNVEGNTWRTTAPATRVFSLAGRALSQTYVLSRVDRRNLTLQTDWDKFFIDGRLFRNRLVVTVFPVGPRQTEVVIRNALEYQGAVAGRDTEASEGAWLPSPDITDEVERFVDAVNIQMRNAAVPRRAR